MSSTFLLCGVHGGLTIVSVDEIMMKTIQMKATEQHFPELVFIMLYKVVE